MNILLIGYRGSGKTTVGRCLAERMQLSFADSDEMIVGRARKNIADIFRDDGEAHFRDLETAVLGDLLAGDQQVLSLGGGVVLREENREMMKRDGRNRIFFLHCDAAELYRRIHTDAKTELHRPALTAGGGGLTEVEQLLEKRLPLYREVMTHEIDVMNLSVGEVVGRIEGLSR